MCGAAIFYVWQAHPRQQDQATGINNNRLPQERVAETSLQHDAAAPLKDKYRGSHSRGQRLTPDDILHNGRESENRVVGKPGRHGKAEEKEGPPESKKRRAGHEDLPRSSAKAESNVRAKTTKDSRDRGTNVLKNRDENGSNSKQRGKCVEIDYTEVYYYYI